MTRFTTATLALVATLLLSGAALSAPKITFFGHSEVAGDRVMLEDVARVQGVADADLKERLRSVDLGAAPQPLQQRTLSRPAVTRALKDAGVDGARVVFPKRIVVWRPGQKVSGNEVTSLARKAVVGYIESATPDGYKARLDGLVARGDLLLPAGKLTAVASSRSSKLGGSMVFSISIRVNGHEAARKQVSARVELEGPTCRLAAAVPRGHVLTRSDLVESTGPVQRDGIGCDAAVGKSIRTSGRVGGVVRASSLEAPVVVRRGERLHVVYESGILRIHAKAEAMKDGAVGEVIPVKNLDSKKVLRARIVSAGRAEVQ